MKAVDVKKNIGAASMSMSLTIICISRGTFHVFFKELITIILISSMIRFAIPRRTAVLIPTSRATTLVCRTL